MSKLTVFFLVIEIELALKLIMRKCGRGDGFMVSVLDSELSGASLSPGWGHSIHGFPFFPYMGMGRRLAALRATRAPLQKQK